MKKKLVDGKEVMDTVKVIHNLPIDKEERLSSVVGRYKSDHEIVILKYSDYGNYDHDTISIKQNLSWILADEELSKEGKDMYIPLKKGENRFLFRAENLGDEPPNTTRILLMSPEGKKIAEFTLKSSLNESTVFYIDF